MRKKDKIFLLIFIIINILMIIILVAKEKAETCRIPSYESMAPGIISAINIYNIDNDTYPVTGKLIDTLYPKYLGYIPNSKYLIKKEPIKYVFENDSYTLRIDFIFGHISYNKDTGFIRKIDSSLVNKYQKEEQLKKDIGYILKIDFLFVIIFYLSDIVKIIFKLSGFHYSH